ncbi:MAG: hypothetical protein ACO266_11315, partial [Steroidobacteraceae bacterium]
ELDVLDFPPFSTMRRLGAGEGLDALRLPRQLHAHGGQRVVAGLRPGESARQGVESLRLHDSSLTPVEKFATDV